MFFVFYISRCPHSTRKVVFREMSLYIYICMGFLVTSKKGENKNMVLLVPA